MMRWAWLAQPDHDAVLECLRSGQRGLGAHDHHTAKKRGAFWRQNAHELDAILRDSRLAEPVAARLTELVDMLVHTRSRRSFLITLTSLIHMHCNRLFAVDSRRLEDLAYDLAVRKTLQARALGLRPDDDREAAAADVRAQV
jgi:lantibiotic biosynthesis protein